MLAGRGGEQGRGLVVDPHRAGLVVLGAVDVGEGGAVDDRVRPVAATTPVDRGRIGDVERGVGQRHDLVAAGVAGGGHLPPEHPGSPGDQDPHGAPALTGS